MRTITAEDILAELEELDRSDSNPVDGTSCVYTDSHGRHCIAGQILENLGLPVPPWNDRSNRVGITELLDYDPNLPTVYGGSLLTDGSVDLLVTAQALADRAVVYGDRPGPRAPWGGVVDRIAGEWRA